VKPYILDDASAIEYQRLDLMSKILDPWTRGYLTALGVGEGWHCLELGGGTGSITEWLAAKVGATGSVTAIDINPVLLELVPAQNLTCSRWTCARVNCHRSPSTSSLAARCCTKSPSTPHRLWRGWQRRYGQADGS
jgi:SAM-dependent methyltransferase